MKNLEELQKPWVGILPILDIVAEKAPTSSEVSAELLKTVKRMKIAWKLTTKRPSITALIKTMGSIRTML